MREILFRGYCKVTKGWVYGNYVKAEQHNTKNHFEHFIIETKSQGGQFKVNPLTVGQFTGLKDKHENKIFEGDRLKAYLHNETEFINDITFRNGTYWFGNFNWIEFLDKFRNIEVIGNLCEDFYEKSN